MSENLDCLLPTSVVPVNYNLHILPDFEKFTFVGTVVVDINICESVREITLHALDLQINAQDVEVLCADKTSSIIAQEIRFDEHAQTATFVFAEELSAGSVVLKIKYNGVLNDKMAGFYRSKYKIADGQEKYLATTQFEATDARRALPCWDEPARKATFAVELVVPNNLIALSNMPVESIKPWEDGKSQVFSFGRTPIMSTYLLAFIIGEFEYVETSTNNGTLVRVYTLPGRSEQGRFALDVGKRSLEFYNNYFDTPYPLPKMDMIAIPDFAAGAMENWGLVTYRENALLIDGANSSVAAKQRVAEVVAHELAHQWFGNLVTMQWWTNLWLNEGFASWMANFVLDNLFPEWDVWTQFLADDYASALSLDGLRSTHPIEVPVNHPDEVAQIFDAISYSKGASVIRMIHDFIGADAFRAGLQIYLKRHAYSNAVTEDLWNALAEASGQPVQKMMDTWTKQAGFPLIQVIQQDENTCVLSQKRFLAGGEQFTEEEAGQTWHIPIASECHQEGKSNYSKHIFSDANMEFPMQGMDFVKLNSSQIALARVNYLPQQWEALTEAISKGKLASADRYGILSDALSLARAGHLSSGQLIRLLSAYKNEDNYTVWMMVLGALGTLENILEETSESVQLASFAQSALRPIVDKLGWQEIVGESHTTKLLRESVLHAIGNYGDVGTINEAVTRFNNHVSGVQLADPNLRKPVYGITAKHGDSQAFNTIVEMYRKEVFQEEKARLLATLGKFTDSVSVSAALEYMFNSGEVRFGDVSYVLSSLGSHTTGRRAAWNFLMNNWETISQRYSGGGLKMLGRIISLICDSFSREEDAQAVENFFKDHPAPSATRAIAEAIERIRIKAAWYERDKDEIADALK